MLFYKYFIVLLAVVSALASMTSFYISSMSGNTSIWLLISGISFMMMSMRLNHERKQKRQKIFWFYQSLFLLSVILGFITIFFEASSITFLLFAISVILMLVTVTKTGQLEFQ